MSAELVPPAVGLLQEFVNTYEPQTGLESLTSASALRTWLAGRELVEPGAILTEPDLADLLTVREGLRNVLLGHAGHEPDPAAVAALSTTLADFPLRLELGPAGYRLISARDDPAGRALGRILDAVRQSTEDGSWGRLKVCARDTCRWAFYDASRNQVRRWCSMAGCGNAMKMRRAYAARKSRAAGNRPD